MSLEEQKNPQNEQIKQVVETTESFPVVKIENPQDLQELVIEKTTEAEVESSELIAQGNTVIENKVKNLGLTPSYIDKGKQMLANVSQKIKDNFNKFTSKLSKVVPLAGMLAGSIIGNGTEAQAQGGGSPEKTKVYTDKKEYEKALEAYNDSLNLHDLQKDYLNTSNELEKKLELRNQLNLTEEEYDSYPRQSLESTIKKWGIYADYISTSKTNPEPSESVGRAIYNPNNKKLEWDSYKLHKKPVIKPEYNPVTKIKTASFEGDRYVPKLYTDKDEYDKAMEAHTDSLNAHIKGKEAYKKWIEHLPKGWERDGASYIPETGRKFDKEIGMEFARSPLYSEEGGNTPSAKSALEELKVEPYGFYHGTGGDYQPPAWKKPIIKPEYQEPVMAKGVIDASDVETKPIDSLKMPDGTSWDKEKFIKRYGLEAWLKATGQKF